MNRGFTYRETITRGQAGAPLLAHLEKHYPHSTPAEWRRRIETGLVLVDGRSASPEEPLSPGMRVSWHRPPWREPDAPATFDLLHEDDALLAVAKPPGLPTMPGAGYLEHTLLTLVRRRFPEASPAHRLGRGTSGVVLFGRTPAARKALAEAFRDRRIAKVYLALVAGEPGWNELTVRTPIGPVAHPVLGTVHAASPEGKASESRFRVVERRGDRTLVEASITTGRPHQIRIHAAASGHPLWGDPLYAEGGVLGASSRNLPGETGYILHAWTVSLPHPATRREIRVEAPPPSVLVPGA